MNDAVIMHILEPDNQVGNKELRLDLSESTLLPNMVSQVTSIEIVHNQIEILSVLKGIAHVDNKRVVKF